MKKFLVVFGLLSVLALSGETFASPTAPTSSGSGFWPAQFNISCGDMSYKVPFDAGDRGTLINVDVTGSATQMDPASVTGYWAGGTGYKVTLTVNDVQVTGSSAAVALQFACYSKSPSPQGLMTCYGEDQNLPTMPDFNMTLLNNLAAPSSNMLMTGSYTRPRSECVR